jgi:anti-sigma factor RsiW
MNCRAIRALLTPYLDDELDDVRREAVRHHLRCCARCRVELSTLDKTVRIIRLWAGVNPPEAGPRWVEGPGRTPHNGAAEFRKPDGKG